MCRKSRTRSPQATSPPGDVACTGQEPKGSTGPRRPLHSMQKSLELRVQVPAGELSRTGDTNCPLPLGLQRPRSCLNQPEDAEQILQTHGSETRTGPLAPSGLAWAGAARRGPPASAAPSGSSLLHTPPCCPAAHRWVPEVQRTDKALCPALPTEGRGPPQPALPTPRRAWPGSRSRKLGGLTPNHGVNPRQLTWGGPATS